MPHIKASDAVRAAVEALPEFLGGREPKGIRVEEVVPPEGSDLFWKVTLSFLEPSLAAGLNPFESLVRGPPLERVLRVIAIDASDGTAKKMIMREAG